MRLKHKVTLITGRNAKTLDEAMTALGGDVLAIQANVTDAAAIEKAVEQVAAKFGKLDILLANAGIGGATPVGRMSEVDEIAKAALHLASDDSANVTGIEITVEGGATSTPAGAPIYRS